jgi:hypothetical protein
MEAIMSIIFTADRIEPGEWDDGRPDPHGERLDLGKDWAVLFRVLDFGEDFANPALAALAVSGGRHLQPDADYGGPRLLEPSLVADIATALDELDEEEIGHRFTHCDTTAAYGAPLDLPSVLEGFEVLCSFYRTAADAADAVLIRLG